MLDGFKKFILRGNVVDMAVGVVIGAAFGGVVAGFSKALITPLIAVIVGKPDYSNLKFMVRGTEFPVGDLVNAAISFVLIAAAVYFFVVLPVNTLIARMNRGERPPDPTTKKCPECLSEIPIEARRCSHCTQPVMGKSCLSTCLKRGSLIRPEDLAYHGSMTFAVSRRVSCFLLDLAPALPSVALLPKLLLNLHPRLPRPPQNMRRSLQPR